MNLEPVIFLNFDDALAIHKFSDNARVLDVNAVAIVDAFPDLWLDVLDSTARRNLETLHKEFQPRYVISSSWASHLNLEGMQTMLKRCGLKFVALNLCAHWCTPRDETSSRLGEIEAWLKLEAWVDDHAYVIIEDHESGAALSGSWLEDRTVFCNARVGFSEAKLVAARQILHGPCK